MKYKMPFSRRGQGLIEILVVMALIGILGGGSVAGYRAFQRSAETAKVKADADSINSAISTPIGYGAKTTVDFWRGLEKNTSNLGVVVSRFMGFANNASETAREMKKMTLFGESVVKMDTTRLTSYAYETEPGRPGIKWDAAQKKVVVATEGERWIQGGTGVLMSSVADTAATGFNNHLAQVKTSLDTSFRSAKKDGWVWDYNAPGVVPTPPDPPLPPEPDIKPVVGIEAVGPTATTWVPEETGSPSVLTYKIQGDWSNWATQEKITVGVDVGLTNAETPDVLIQITDALRTTTKKQAEPVEVLTLTKDNPIATLNLYPSVRNEIKGQVRDSLITLSLRGAGDCSFLPGNKTAQASISHTTISLAITRTSSECILGNPQTTNEYVYNDTTGAYDTKTRTTYPDRYWDLTYRISATNNDENTKDFTTDTDPDNYNSAVRQIRMPIPQNHAYLNSTPAPSIVASDEIKWDIGSLPFGQTVVLDITYRFKPEVLVDVGLPITVTAYTDTYNESATCLTMFAIVEKPDYWDTPDIVIKDPIINTDPELRIIMWPGTSYAHSVRDYNSKDDITSAVGTARATARGCYSGYIEISVNGKRYSFRDEGVLYLTAVNISGGIRSGGSYSPTGKVAASAVWGPSYLERWLMKLPPEIREILESNMAITARRAGVL